MVRRFVEQQQRWPAEEQLGERDAHLPAAGERLGRLVEVVTREAEPHQHLRDLEVDRVAVFVTELLGQVVVFDEQRFVLAIGERFIRERVFDALHFALRVEQRRERERHLIEQSAAAVVEAVLRQIADRRHGRHVDLAAVGFVEPGEHAEERGLAGAVWSAQADAFPVGHLPGDVIEEDTFAERFREGGELDHAPSAVGTGSPRARAAAARMRGRRNGLVR